eukprot:10071839-Prorocentrum_lima.AAC.1
MTSSLVGSEMCIRDRSIRVRGAVYEYIKLENDPYYDHGRYASDISRLLRETDAKEHTLPGTCKTK